MEFFFGNNTTHKNPKETKVAYIFNIREGQNKSILILKEFNVLLKKVQKNTNNTNNSLQEYK